MKQILFLLLFTVVLAIGCATPRTQSDPRIVIDSSVPSAVQVLTVDYGKTKGENPVVSLSVRNTGHFSRRIQYRAVWFDQSGNPVDSVVSNWKSATLDSGETADLRAVSPRADAETFRFELRKAN